jgi:hypothetical protein
MNKLLLILLLFIQIADSQVMRRRVTASGGTPTYWTATADEVVLNAWGGVAWDEGFPNNSGFGSNDTIYTALVAGAYAFNPVTTLTPVFWVEGGSEPIAGWSSGTDYSVNDEIYCNVEPNQRKCAIACGPSSDWGPQDPDNPVPFWQLYADYQIWHPDRPYTVGEKVLNTQKTLVYECTTGNTGHNPEP